MTDTTVPPHLRSAMVNVHINCHAMHTLQTLSTTIPPAAKTFMLANGVDLDAHIRAAMQHVLLDEARCFMAGVTAEQCCSQPTMLSLKARVSELEGCFPFGAPDALAVKDQVRRRCCCGPLTPLEPFLQHRVVH